MASPYEGDETIKKDFTFSDIVIMIKILNYIKDKNIEETYESQIAKEIEYTPARLNKIIKYLKELKIIEETDKIGSNKMIKINKSLKHFLDEQDIIIWLKENFLSKYNTYRYRDY